MDKKEILKGMKMFSERTIENGCSEAEAMLAAKKLSELQAKYNVTLTESTFKRWTLKFIILKLAGKHLLYAFEGITILPS